MPDSPPPADPPDDRPDEPRRERDDRPDDRPPRAERERDRERPDDYDRDYRPRRPRPDRDDDGNDGTALGGLIPLKNGPALAAYYCGVFSFIPCLWGTLSIVAVILGFVGLSKANTHPSAKGKGHAIAGIVCGFLTLLMGVAGVVSLALMWGKLL